jgi:hypothetical protein
MTWTVDYRNSAVSNCTVFSRAVRDEDWTVVQRLLDERGRRDDNHNRSTIEDVDEEVDKIQHRQRRQRRLVELWWRPNSRGWTSMHVAAARCSCVSPTRWRWILHQAMKNAVVDNENDNDTNIYEEEKEEEDHLSSSPYCQLKTEMGHSVFDIFFRTSVRPLSWQKQSIRRHADDLRSAMEELLQNDDKTKEEKSIVFYRLRQTLSRRREEMDDQSISSCLCVENDTNTADAPTNDNLEVIVMFFIQLLDMVEMARYGSINHTRRRADNTTDLRLPLLHLLADLPWCPEIVGKMATALFPHQVRDADDDDESISYGCAGLPLHRWCRAPISTKPSSPATNCKDTTRDICVSGVYDLDGFCSVNETGEDDPGILPALCAAFPDAARVHDTINNNHTNTHHRHCHRFALHMALATGKSWHGHRLGLIAIAHPKALELCDPCTGLPACCLPAIHNRASFKVDSENKEYRQVLEETAKQMEGGVLSHCWLYLSKQDRRRAMERAKDYLERDELNTIFQVLRLNPSVLTIPDSTTEKKSIHL